MSTPSDAQESAPGPLAGVRVIDLTTVVFGPSATQVLGDLGADVVKVEPPGGDISRAAGHGRSPGMGHFFLNANRNKRSVVLDLKDPEHRDALLALCAGADVLVYNIRPAAMQRLRLGYEDVRAVNPRIIHAGGVGFGQSGPYAARPAYDDLMQAMSGSANLLGRVLPESPEGDRPTYVPINFCDRVSGLHLVYAIIAALYARERTGVGQAIEVPMFETMSAFVLADNLGGATFDPPEGSMGYSRIVTRGRRPYATRDGHITVLPYNDKHWGEALELFGRTDLARDPRFATQAQRSRNADAVYEFIAGELAKRSTAEWLELLADTDIPHARINAIEDLPDDPHLTAVGFFERYHHPHEGDLVRTRHPVEFSATPASVRRPVPRLGEHTAEVLREAGLDETTIGRLAGATSPNDKP